MNSFSPSLVPSEKGFTLIELMIVVAIIGILAAVAIPKFADMMRKSKEAYTKGGLTNLRSAITLYVSDNEGFYPSDNLETLYPKYISDLPITRISPYHDDKNAVRTSQSLGCASLYNADTSEWVYCNEEDRSYCAGFPPVNKGLLWILCVHTDSKNVYITSW